MIDMDTRASRQEAILTHSRTSQDFSRMEDIHHKLVRVLKALNSDLTRPSFLPLVYQQALVVFMVGSSQPHRLRLFRQYHSNRILLRVFMGAITLPCTIFSLEVNCA